MNKISTDIKKRTKPNDKFYTPLSLVKIHLEKFNIPDGSIIYEPFYGTGNYYNELCKKFPLCTIFFTEIDLDKDFFDFNKKIDYIISNPPYSIIDKVLEKSCQLKPKVISYLIAFHNLTAKRIEYMNKEGYYIINFHLTKVFKWYGMSLIITFSNEVKNNIIDIDRIVHK
jgi:hypothetical protein